MLKPNSRSSTAAITPTFYPQLRKTGIKSPRLASSHRGRLRLRLERRPPINHAAAFIAGEPYCHIVRVSRFYSCFRYFNGVPPTILATVEEHFTGNFPCPEPNNTTKSMPRINPLRKNKPATKPTKVILPPEPPATNIIPISIVPSPPLWKQRTTNHYRFTLP